MEAGGMSTNATYRCNHFRIEELVPKSVLEELGAQRCWWLFDEQGLITIDKLREDLGVSLMINDWFWGGDQQYSGFRPPDCDVGAAFSQHRFGRAFDIKPEGKWNKKRADEVRDFIRTRRERYPWIRTLETDISWVHIDGRNHPQFLEFSP